MDSKDKEEKMRRETKLFAYCVVVVMLLFALLVINPYISWRERMSGSIEGKEQSLEELKQSCENMRLEIEALRSEANE